MQPNLTRVVNPPLLLLAAATIGWAGGAAVAQTSQPGTAAPADLPDAAAIIDRALTAMGGREAVAEVKNISYTVTVETQSMQTPMLLRSAGPEKMLATVKSPNGSEMHMGRLGKVAWTNASGSYQLVPESQVGQINQIDLYGLALGLAHGGDRYQTTDRLEMNGHDCYKVLLAEDVAGPTYGYFQTDTGTLHAIDQLQTSPMGKMLITTALSDYQDHEPLRLFGRASLTARPENAPPAAAAGMTLASLSFSEVSFNGLTDDDFVLPSGVRALMAAGGDPGDPASRPTSRPTSRPAPRPAPGPAGDGDLSPLVKRTLERVNTMDDVGQLRMMATLLEGQVASVKDEQRADYELLVEHIKKRIATLESGG